MTEPAPGTTILVDFVDPEGRTWVAAGVLGPLVRHEDGKPAESMLPGLTKGKEMRISGLRVVDGD